MVLGQRVLGTRVFDWLMTKTVYGQFVGGDSLATLKPRVSVLAASGVRSILDYAVEDDVPATVVMETRSGVTGDGRGVSGDTTNVASARTFLYVDEQQCVANKQHFINSIDTVAEVADNGRPFAAIKLTGLGRVEFLVSS